MLLTYSIAKAKRELCDLAQFVVVQNILTPVMTSFVVDKSTDHAKRHFDLFFYYTTISKITK